MHLCFVLCFRPGLCHGLQSLRVAGNPQTRIRPEICNRGTKGLISYLHGRMQQREQDALKRERDISLATYVEYVVDLFCNCPYRRHACVCMRTFVTMYVLELLS